MAATGRSGCVSKSVFGYLKRNHHADLRDKGGVFASPSQGKVVSVLNQDYAMKTYGDNGSIAL
jgi:hypothetical protein